MCVCVALAGLAIAPAGAVTREAATNMCNSFADKNSGEDRPAFIAKCMSNLTIDSPTPQFAKETGNFFGASALVWIMLIGFALYFVPTIVAHFNKKTNFAAIFILNIFLGWTLVGWVIALVWAVMREPEQRPA